MNKPRRQPRDRIDGVLLLDKPHGLSSNDALMRARRLLNAAKAGHGGTLDPMATGLLPLMFGEATKFADDSLAADKTYLAELTLGVATDTADAEGRPIAQREVRCDEAQFRAAAAAFVGEIEQTPPMHSALKRDGKPLYEYARAGIEVERAARRVTIHAIEVLSFAAPVAVIRVSCSKGTYIRTLAADIGERLGCGAHLSGLRRERVGALAVADAITLPALEALAPAERAARLAPVDALLAGLPQVRLDAALAARFLHGQRLHASVEAGEASAEPALAATPAAQGPVGPRTGNAAPRVRVYHAERLLGVAQRRADGLLIPLRLIATGAADEPRNIPVASH
ncbi:MAG: tRNA pseudouridine(55) synthase TruB [Burkholderiales bacterium]|nr:tRNA pseudouridine(55) synthase TruB [Burkholderiales bacterium]